MSSGVGTAWPPVLARLGLLGIVVRGTFPQHLRPLGNAAGDQGGCGWGRVWRAGSDLLRGGRWPEMLVALLASFICLAALGSVELWGKREQRASAEAIDTIERALAGRGDPGRPGWRSPPCRAGRSPR